LEWLNQSFEPVKEFFLALTNRRRTCQRERERERARTREREGERKRKNERTKNDIKEIRGKK